MTARRYNSKESNPQRKSLRKLKLLFELKYDQKVCAQHTL
jgi:hypothetical protein